MSQEVLDIQSESCRMTKTSLSLSFLLLLVKDSWAALRVRGSESLVTPKVIEINGPFGQRQAYLEKIELLKDGAL